jgi:hypothetical protein
MLRMAPQDEVLDPHGEERGKAAGLEPRGHGDQKKAIPTDGPNSDGSKAAFAYSMTSTIRWVRGSTRTVRPFTTV